MFELYQILGIEKHASADDIKKAYRKAALVHHPDKGGDPEMFKKVQKANEVLSNPDTRSFYDQTGQVPGEDSGGGPGGGGFPFGFGGGGGPFGGGIHVDMNDIFGSMFGRMGANRQPEVRRKPEAKIVDIPLSLFDFYHGKKIIWNLHQKRFCKKCNGQKYTNISQCGACRGAGNITVIQQRGPMIIQSTQPCGDCQGRGKQMRDPCGECQGSGQYSVNKELVVEIKPGMKPGDTIIFQGESSVVEGYLEPGDIIGRLQEAEDPNKWERQGYDIWNTCSITLSESLLGCKMGFAGFPKDNMEFTVELPVGVQNKSIVSIHGQGLPRGDGGFGHCFINVIVKPVESELRILKDQNIILQSIFQKPQNNNVRENVYTSTLVE